MEREVPRTASGLGSSMSCLSTAQCHLQTASEGCVTVPANTWHAHGPCRSERLCCSIPWDASPSSTDGKWVIHSTNQAMICRYFCPNQRKKDKEQRTSLQGRSCFIYGVNCHVSYPKVTTSTRFSHAHHRKAFVSHFAAINGRI